MVAERMVEIDEIKVAARCSGAITSDARHSPSCTTWSESRAGRKCLKSSPSESVCPATSTSRSPARTPAAAAGVPGSTLDTMCPLCPRAALIVRPNLCSTAGAAAWGGGVGRARQAPWARLTCCDVAASRRRPRCTS